jgi:hypothetical protein
MLVYTVIAELPDAAVAREFLGWLEDDHLGDVVRAGALDGEAVLRDDPDDGAIVECRYRFASRESFAAYEAGPAAALRAEGRARFGPERGIRMRRTIGEVRVRRG